MKLRTSLAGGLLAGLAGLAGLAAAPAASAASAAGSPVVHVHLTQTLCLGIGAERTNAPAGYFTCVAHPDQEWRLQGTLQRAEIVNRQGMCLGVGGEKTFAGARVYGWRCLGHPDQFWAIQTVNEGNLRFNVFVNLNATSANHNGLNYVLTAPGGNVVVIWPEFQAGGFPDQHWFLTLN